jgi:tRNA (guanine-N7-)-methyltransferase
MTEQQHRSIRSFVRREGRLTRGQQRALAVLWPQFGIDRGDSLLDLEALFGRAAPKVLEIGFGMGTSLAAMAAARPEWDFVGIEVHRPGVGTLLRQVEAQGLRNVRVICDDAVEVLKQRIPDASLDRVLLFFPDPWHKKRHHKRRIVQPDFVALVAIKLKPGGVFHLATDWEDYAEHMLAVVGASPAFRNLAGAGCYAPRSAERPLTKFEQRGRRLGHGVWDLLFERAP